MWKKGIAGAIALSSVMGAGCTKSGARTASVVTAGIGVFAVVTAAPGAHGCGDDELLCDEDSWDPFRLILLGVPAFLTSAGFLLASSVMDDEPEAAREPWRGPPGQAAAAPAPVGDIPYPLVVGSTETHRKLLLQLRISARAGRCSSVTVMMQRLSVVNDELARWSASADVYVKSCLAAAAPAQDRISG